MKSMCYTLDDGMLTQGICAKYLGMPGESFIPCINVSILSTNPSEDGVTLGERGWEVIPIYKVANTADKGSGCIIHLDMNTWIPCPERRDESILLDVYEDKSALVYCPREATLLRNVYNDTLLAVDSSGRPTTDMITELPSVPRSIEGVYEEPLRIPSISPRLGLSSEDNLRAKRLHLQEDDSSAQEQESQD